MNEEQLNYLLQSQYLPSGNNLNVGSMGVTPALLQGTGFQPGTMGFYPPFKGTQTIFPSNISPTMSNLDLSSLPENMGVANEEDVEQVEYLTEPSGIRQLLQYLPFGDKSLFKRGLEGISNLIPRSDPRAIGIRNFYRPYEGITNTGAVASGLMAGYNPVSGFGKNKKFGLSRAMQRRIERIEETLKKKDSQQLRDRVSKLRELQRQEMQDRVDRGESLSDIGKSTFTGKGMAFEKRSGGKSIVDGKERNYGGR